MLLNEIQMSAAGHSEHRPDLPEQSEKPDAAPEGEPPPFVDPLELEALALVLEHSLKVHTSHHFFCWTQGLLQNLIRHELLICAIRKGESPAFHVDSFSSGSVEPVLINNLFTQDTTLVPHILKIWEENRFDPLIYPITEDHVAAASPLGRELSRLGIADILIHGTYDTFGRPASLFLFASQPGAIDVRHNHLAALLVPSLHAAWVHTQFTRSTPTGLGRGQAGGNDILTARELEILGWIGRGKSNIEIGMILGISPLTVKNHVQKILRRLNVLNRAQAVGKALALRILDTSSQR